MGWLKVLFVLLLDSSINTQTITNFFWSIIESSFLDLKKAFLDNFFISDNQAFCNLFGLLPILEVVYIKKSGSQVKKTGIYEEIKECVLYFSSLNTLNNKKK